MEKLFDHWKKIQHMEEYNKNSKILKDSLGPEMERFIKLKKIRKKM